MALLPILRFPDPRLKKVALPVANVDDSIRKLVADMAETMYEAPGIGLAATQVDVHKRVVVIDVSEDKSELQAFINPVLSRCAVCLQHELDHLNGTVFVDHLSLLKQARIKNKLAKQARVTA